MRFYSDSRGLPNALGMALVIAITITASISLGIVVKDFTITESTSSAHLDITADSNTATITHTHGDPLPVNQLYAVFHVTPVSSTTNESIQIESFSATDHPHPHIDRVTHSESSLTPGNTISISFTENAPYESQMAVEIYSCSTPDCEDATPLTNTAVDLS